MKVRILLVAEVDIGDSARFADRPAAAVLFAAQEEAVGWTRNPCEGDVAPAFEVPSEAEALELCNGPLRFRVVE